ncbi:hypothetical protein J3R30DRAFT_3882938 [Lentinula aciculospora]|uniref:PIN domain-like protein n=1 Tax=Lentinula aciculospora TaxID=153920 RepID=A0A9W9ACX6_9AGAR|nr:hypothetical protein J3R30DRAFT_3882938 [Lentinula aciculospora]
MGVAGLWPLLEPAQSVTTLTALSLTKFDATSRGFRIGIDASIWFFHAEYGKEGENPELRTLFFRCAQLLSQGFLPLFIFDGPLRPDIKRGKRINKSANKLVTGMQAIIEAFGFEYRTAPGEAEAELALLNRIGVIDGILSDDVDNFLFGAHTVVRNHSSTHAGAKSTIEKAKVYTYTLPHPAFPDVGPEELIFIALCSGGDYGTGLDNCGVKISYGLARAGFGKSLCQAALTHDENSLELQNFIHQWKSQLAKELKTNASGFLPRKSPKLANTIPESFPDIKVLLAYLRPVTSESLGRSARYDDLLVNNSGQDGWLKKDPSLSQLAEKCEFYFEWGFLKSIIKRFRTVIFHGVVLRILRRACLSRKTGSFDANMINLDAICAHFASGDHPVVSGKSSCPALIKNISKTRTHESTSQTLEYRVALDPTILVQLTTRGVKGIRRPDDKDEWAEFEKEAGDESSGDEGGGIGKSKKEYPDPTLPLKLWLPAVLVKEAIPDVVEAYEESRRRKEEKKTGKGRKVEAIDGQEPKIKSLRKPRPKPKSAAPSATLKAKPTDYKPALKRDDVNSSDDDMEYNERLFLLSRPTHTATYTRNNNMDRVSIHNTRSVSPDTSSSDHPSSSASYYSSPPPPPPPPQYRSGSSLNVRIEDIKYAFKVSKSSTLGKGKQKATVSRADSLLSTIDDIATPKKNKNKKGENTRFESSSPEKITPRPFPVLIDNPFDVDDSDDPDFNDSFKAHHMNSPAPGPPQTPSPQKKTRKSDAVVYSDSSGSDDDSSSRKDTAGILNKSPRKSNDHKYPKGLVSANGDQVRKTIRDIPHPSRARTTSPTPMRRTPIKATSAFVSSTNKPVASTRVSSIPPLLTSSSAHPPPPTSIAGPIIISDSEDEETEREEPPPKVAPKSQPRSNTKAAKRLDIIKSHTDKLAGSSPSKPTSTTFKSTRRDLSDTDDDSDIPPLSRARARSKVAEQPKMKAKVKMKTTMTTTTTTTRMKAVVDIIELSDDSS